MLRQRVITALVLFALLIINYVFLVPYRAIEVKTQFGAYNIVRSIARPPSSRRFC